MATVSIQPESLLGRALPERPLRWLFLDLNSYFASVEQQLQPILRDRPVIVVPVMTDSTVAVAASYEAKAFGIHTGTPVWEARAKCRELVVVPARPARYVEFHEAIVAEIWRHIPVTKVCSIDEVACRLLDNENAPDQTIALARRIKAGIAARVGPWLTSSIGIAPSRLLAKLASDMEKPDGLVLLSAQELPRRLFPLKLRDIAGIGANMERRLARTGILDIEGLCTMHPRAVGRAWGGVGGDRLWYLLHGFDLPEAPSQRRSIGHSHVLSPRERGAEPARATARRLAAKAASRLRRDEFAAGTMMLHARFEADRGRWDDSLHLAQTQDSFAILAGLDRLWGRLEQAAVTRPGGLWLRKIGVTLLDLAPAAHRQEDLFPPVDIVAPQAREARSNRLSRAIDRIEGRFGRGAVTLGPASGGRADRVGGNIAFNYIPHRNEFSSNRHKTPA